MQIDRLHFYLENAIKWRDWFVAVMGFQAIASYQRGETHTEVVASGSNEEIKFVLSSPLTRSSPVAKYLDKHPPGVADITFAVEELQTVMDKAIAAGATILEPIKQKKYKDGYVRWSKISNNVSFCHTLVERQGKTVGYSSEPKLQSASKLKNITQRQSPLRGSAKERKEKVFLRDIDHLVLNVPAGELEATANWYEQAFGFIKKQTFTINTQQSGLYSQVMVHPVSGIQLPINEPLSSNSQIQEFLDLNGGAGIQHIALKTNNITKVTQKLRQAGLSFLSVPSCYYEQIAFKGTKFNLSAQKWQEIVEQEVLVDFSSALPKGSASQSATATTEGLAQRTRTKRANLSAKQPAQRLGEAEIAFAEEDRDDSPIPFILQIFTEPIFAQPTFFFELIERRYQAQGFGEGNFRALFKAIEQEQAKRGSLSKSKFKIEKYY
jgi:4-hydroxyphenylpyruvate dioxygenase